MCRVTAWTYGLVVNDRLAPARRSLRGAARRDDLVRRLSGELRHVIELEREAADAGGGGSDLDDEIADLGFRHHRPHHLPAAPAFARVQAEALAAPARPAGLDPRRRLGTVT